MDGGFFLAATLVCAIFWILRAMLVMTQRIRRLDEIRDHITRLIEEASTIEELQAIDPPKIYERLLGPAMELQACYLGQWAYRDFYPEVLKK